MNSIKEIIEVVDIICATNGARFRPQDGVSTEIVTFYVPVQFQVLCRNSTERCVKIE